MKRLILFLIVSGVAGSPAGAATPVYVTPDAPTDETASGSTILPWETSRYDSPPGYTLVLAVPGDPAVDAIHKLDKPGDWLLSVEAATDLAGLLTPDAFGSTAEQRDVIHYDSAAGAYSRFFCGANVFDPVPVYANVDAIYLDGEDFDDLIVSFDVPTTIPAGGTTFEPSDLVRYVRSPAGGTACNEWALAGVPLVLDASATAPPIPISVNVTGADGLVSGDFILAIDVPADLPATFLREEVVLWDGVAFSLYEPLIGWPSSSEVDGLSCAGSPGDVQDTLILSKPGGFPPDIELCWSSSCSDGGVDEGIYEGTLGSWYSHDAIDCFDDGADNCETITPAAGDTYYLIVPHNDCDGEGSYSRDYDNASGVENERPVGGVVCEPTQLITTCP